MIKGIHHISVVVSDTAKARAFYRDILELNEVPRNPMIPFPGAWFEIGERHLHILEVPNQDPTDRVGPGVEDRHIALVVDSIHYLMEHLDGCDWPYVFRDKSNAVFVRDPDGNAIEFVQSDWK